MSNEYIPRDEEVRDWAASGYLYMDGHPHLGFVDCAAFDRWLALHDRAVGDKARADVVSLFERGILAVDPLSVSTQSTEGNPK